MDARSLRQRYVRFLLAACTLAFGTLSPGAGRAEETAPADSFLHQYAATFRFRLGRPTAIQVSPTSDAVFYLRSGPRNFVQDLYVFDPRTGEERVLLTAEQILLGASERLSTAEKARRERMRLAARGIAGFQLSRDGRLILIPLSGRVFLFEQASGAIRELDSAAGAIDPRFSFDAHRVAFHRDGDLWVMDTAGGSARRLTKHEQPDVSWGDAEFVAQEEMGRFHGYWWSPDGKRIASQRTDVSSVEKFHIADPAHPEQPPQSWAYPRPGRANADVQLFLVPVERGKIIEVTWDRTRFPYLARVVWEANSPLTVLVQNREQTEEVLLAVDERTGASRELLTERDEAWLNLDEEMPRWLEDGSGFLWTSERDGAWRLELRARDGELLRPVTPLEFGYRGFVDVDTKHEVAWVKAGTDPTQIHLWSVPLGPESGEPRCLTREAGVHSAVASKDHGIWVHTFDGVQGERLQTVRRWDGAEVGSLTSVAESPAVLPGVEFTTVGDSVQFHAAIIRPRTFDPKQRYPVLVDVYGGPSAQMVQATSYRYLIDQWFAARGFVVVMLDGRGTPARGRAWDRALRGSFIDVPLADQITGLQALGKRYPELDLERAGIFGWSYGGYVAALAVMRRPDVFRAAVAGAPVTNWYDYDTHYTERYIGVPDVGAGKHEQSVTTLEQPAATVQQPAAMLGEPAATPGKPAATIEQVAANYERSSVLSSAHLLERPLLILHGTDDDNVYLTHSLQLCDALQRAGKQFEFLPLIGFTHMVTDPLVTERLQERIAEFFMRELGGPQPAGRGKARTRGDD